MEDKIYITIGIPIFNAELYLEQAIKSVLYQTYPYWELILVDDGSTDNSLFIAKKYASMDTRIRVISDGKNKKLPARLNQIVREAKHDYIARMDADDIMFPHRLEKQIEFLINNKQFDLISSGMVSIDSKNNIVGFRKVDSLYHNFNKIESSYPILHPGVLARKSWCLRNAYSLDYPRAEDYELWSRAIYNNDFNMAVTNELLMFYREEGNLSLSKILQSYNQVSKIHFKYTGSYKNIIRMNCKKIALMIIYLSGNLQYLAKRRNRTFLLDTEREEYQSILNGVLRES